MTWAGFRGDAMSPQGRRNLAVALRLLADGLEDSKPHLERLVSPVWRMPVSIAVNLLVSVCREQAAKLEEVRI